MQKKTTSDTAAGDANSDATKSAATKSANRRRKGKPPQELAPRNDPVQRRSRRRSKQIIDVTGQLLEQVGLDDLTTIVIAKAVGISVGSLYHYFPNKHAILYAMGLRWLEQVEATLEEINQWPIEELPLEQLVERMLGHNLKAYNKQIAILALVKAMFSVPELRELDDRHDQLVISHMARLFQRIGIQRPLKERQRIARLYLEMTHAIFLVAVKQQPTAARRTLADLKTMVVALLNRHLAEPSLQ